MQDGGRSSLFRYSYSNGNKIITSDNELTIIFGIKENTAEPSQLFEEIGVVMTHETARLLLGALHQSLGQPVTETSASTPPLPAGSVELENPTYSELENAIRLAVDAQRHAVTDEPG